MASKTQNQVSVRVELLRQWMRGNHIEAFIVPSTDPHASEYVPSHWEARQWLSGFTGSAGTAVVTLDNAALWTDSRYFLAAEEQLEGTPFQLMRERMEGTPDIAQWLVAVLHKGDTVGIDGWVNSVVAAESWRTTLERNGISLDVLKNPFDTIGASRPLLPENAVEIQPFGFAGETTASKAARIRPLLDEKGANAMLVSALDEIAWLTNLRGSDVHCNPVFVAYCLLLPQEIRLYINKEKLTKSVKDYLSQENITVRPYTEIENDLQALEKATILLTPETNVRLAAAVAQNNTIVNAPSPIATLKAVKNEAETEGFRRAMLRDGVALVKFLRWLKPAVKAGGVTEMDVDRKLTSLRAAQPLFRDISFDTIAGYADHGAIVHYEATEATDRELHPEGLLLIDSGAQYQDGTTDITRTIALGEPTEKERHIYTLVLKGHIALARLKFPSGASGTQLDLSARYAMWQEGYNFGHGTGHGVGSYLNVHEGPHQIRMNYMPAPIVAGMTVTDEPGLYLPGCFGVRTENMLLAVPFKETEFGKFLQFETLTLCPIDTVPIDREMLTFVEKQWLNDYHQTVRNKLMPLLDDEADRQWLYEATLPIQ